MGHTLSSFDGEYPRFIRNLKDLERLGLDACHPWRSFWHSRQGDALYSGALDQQFLDCRGRDMAFGDREDADLTAILRNLSPPSRLAAHSCAERVRS
jgi:hypothetical protein